MTRIIVNSRVNLLALIFMPREQVVPSNWDKHQAKMLTFALQLMILKCTNTISADDDHIREIFATRPRHQYSFIYSCSNLLFALAFAHTRTQKQNCAECGTMRLPPSGCNDVGKRKHSMFLHIYLNYFGRNLLSHANARNSHIHLLLARTLLSKICRVRRWHRLGVRGGFSFSISCVLFLFKHIFYDMVMISIAYAK